MNAWFLSVSLAVLSLCALPAAASNDDYERLLDAALAAQEGRDYERAHALFAAAHALQPNARTLRAQGVASYGAGQIERAVRELEQALAHPVKPLDEELRQAVSELLARARAQLLEQTPTLAVAPETPALAPIERDPPAAPAGPVEKPSTDTTDAPAPQGSMLESQADQPPSAKSAAEDRLPRPRKAAWILGAAALGSLLTAGLVFRAGNARVEKIAQACGSSEIDGCSTAERDAQLQRAHLDRFETATNVLLGVSAAALVSSVTLAWWSIPRGRSERSFALNAGAQSVGMRVSF
jgi:hypothetical protein